MTLFQTARNHTPSAPEIAGEAIEICLGKYAEDKAYIKANFSDLIDKIQQTAYDRYKEYERLAFGKSIRHELDKHIHDNLSKHDIFDLLENQFSEFDRYFLSLTQSRRTRAGGTFEIVVSSLFQKLEYPYTPQPNIGNNRPDYVMPNVEYYEQYAADCIILTCKRTVRERWRQIVTEGIAGRSYYLATIDDQLTKSGLSSMKKQNVLVVLPARIKSTLYSDILNVISFEEFFEHHLDVALNRWKSAGVI